MIISITANNISHYCFVNELIFFLQVYAFVAPLISETSDVLAL